MRFRRLHLRTVVAAVVVVTGPGLSGVGAANAGAKEPTVIELFTSQGCNACPAADDVFADLSRRDDIVALSFHVNYWDYLGWKDTLATDETTDRQRTYASFLGERSVYTPQIVIGGVRHEVGSRRQAVTTAIDRVAENQEAMVEVSATADGDGNLHVRVWDGELRQRDVIVWLLRFDKTQVVEIKRGENRGRTLAYHNVVRDFRKLGMWYGKVMDLNLGLAKLREGGRDGAAILVQENGAGHIIGALAIDLDKI